MTLKGKGLEIGNRTSRLTGSLVENYESKEDTPRLIGKGLEIGRLAVDSIVEKSFNSGDYVVDEPSKLKGKMAKDKMIIDTTDGPRIAEISPSDVNYNNLAALRNEHDPKVDAMRDQVDSAFDAIKNTTVNN